MITIKSFILKPIRYFINKIVGINNIEKSIIFMCRLSEINLLTLAYNHIGILNYQNSDISGEDLVIKKILPHYFSDRENLFFFDVGAHTGSYSQKLREKFIKAKIYAFEPNQFSFKDLLGTLFNLDIKIYNLGFSSKLGREKIYTYTNEINSQHASLYKNVLLDLHLANNVIETTFNATTIDDFCETHKIDFIDFLKLDTEGHEYDILIGAKQMLSNNKIKIIQFEFNEMNIISRVFLKDFYEVLKNYNIYRLDSNKLIPLFKYSSDNEIFKFQNLLAINKNLSIFFT